MKQAATKRYAVTITVADADHEETVTVTASDEWGARTAAMFACTYPLSGEHVEYLVTEIR